MATPSYKTLYNDARKESAQKGEQIVALTSQVTELQQKLLDQATVHEGQLAESKKEAETLQEEKDQVDEENETVKTKNKELTEQLRKMELSRFASAYATQEKEYKEQQDLWFKLALGATGLLTISVLGSIFGPHLLRGTQWYTEPGFYLLNVIFVTLFVYTLKQHAHFGNLRIDYANRKTLAQSYQYIIEDEEETSEVRKRFLERAADVFSSKATPKGSDVTIYEAIMAKFFIGGKQN